MTPQISIITPVYNAESDIVDTIESVLGQSFMDWELILVDDCSTDKSKIIIDKFCSKDTRIRYAQNKKNSGPAATRNHGLKLARAKYIAFLDSDDIWMPNKLLDQLTFIKENKLGLCFTRYRRFKEINNPGHLVEIPNTIISYNQLLRCNWIATSTVLLDKELTGEIKMNTSVYYDDYTLWLELVKNGVLTKGMDSDLMRYRVRENSVSRNKLNSAVQVWKIFNTTQDLSFLSSVYYFTSWVINSLKKHKEF